VTLSRAGAVALIALVGMTGCVTQADLTAQNRRLRGMIVEQRRQLEQMQHELERLRSEVEEGGGRRGGQDRVTELERRMSQIEQGGPSGTPPPAEEKENSSEEKPGDIASAGVTTTTLPAKPTLPPPSAEEMDEWHKEVAREQASVGTMNVPERADYLAALDNVQKKDCTRAIPQLNSFAASHKDSALADNALYWAARCYGAKNDSNQAISKFYDVVTRYPKGDKTPAALWAQGNLFIQVGDTPDARLALSKLIRDYPSSPEAAQARQKLTELER